MRKLHVDQYSEGNLREYQDKIYLASVKIFNRGKNENEANIGQFDKRRICVWIVYFKNLPMTMCTQAGLVIKEGAIRSTFVLHSPNSMNGFVIGQHATSKDVCPVSMGFMIMHLAPCSTQKVASRRNFMNLSLTELVDDTRNENLDDVYQIHFPWFTILLLKTFPAKMPSSAQ